MLKRFYDLRQNIAGFMHIKRNTINQVKDDEWVCDLAFLVDVTGYRNELNIKLQKNKDNWFMNCIDMSKLFVIN
jgi:hypothetical protein